MVLKLHNSRLGSLKKERNTEKITFANFTKIDDQGNTSLGALERAHANKET